MSLASAIAETRDCVGNECSDINSEQKRRVGREAARAAGRQRKRDIHQYSGPANVAEVPYLEGFICNRKR